MIEYLQVIAPARIDAECEVKHRVTKLCIYRCRSVRFGSRREMLAASRVGNGIEPMRILTGPPIRPMQSGGLIVRKDLGGGVHQKQQAFLERMMGVQAAYRIDRALSKGRRIGRSGPYGFGQRRAGAKHPTPT